MVATAASEPKKICRNLVLPREYLLGLFHLTGWTAEWAAWLVSVDAGTVRTWIAGSHRIPAAAWRLLLIRAGLPETWRPSPALCWELSRAPPQLGMEPWQAWCRAKARRAEPVRPVPVERRTVLRKRPVT